MIKRTHIGWMIFATVMVWFEAIGDVPRLILPYRSTPEHVLTAFMNVSAVIGLTVYALQFNRLRVPWFWRIFAPTYAFYMALLLGRALPALLTVVSLMVRTGGNTPLAALGALILIVPISAILVFTLIAIFRLGDWIGPTRRPLGERQQQLSLPI